MLYHNFKINKNNQSVIFKVQANKNLGIIDINDSEIRADFLNKFQGRQLNSQEVCEEIGDYLYERA